MPIRLCALALVSFLLWSDEEGALGQVVYELQPLPPLEDTAVAENPVSGESDWGLWGIPSFSEAIESLRHGRLYYSADLLLLNSIAQAVGESDDKIAASRYQLGWELPSGVGMRGRYQSLDIDWQVLNTNGTVVDVSSGANLVDYLPYFLGDVLIGRDIDTFHVDIYRRLVAGQTQFLLGGGAAFIRNQKRYELLFDTGTPGGDYTYDFSDETTTGTGLSLVGEVRHPLWVRDTYQIDFLLSGRLTYVPGEFEAESTLLNLQADNDVWLNEGSTGIEWLKRYRNLVFRVRGQLEAQKWNYSFIGDEKFTGASLSFGVGW
jgi:hypothetical protein